MNTAAKADARIKHVRVTSDEIIAEFIDGRVVSVPLVWSWRLSEATPAQRARHEIVGSGRLVRWPDIDEDLSAEGMLCGTPAPRPGKRTRASLSKQRGGVAARPSR